jgi:phosphate transport system permease protein
MRRFTDRLFRFATGASAFLACTLLLGIVGIILLRALPGLDLSLFIHRSSTGFGSADLAYQILGTVVLMATALLVSVPLAIGLALADTVYLAPRAARRLRLGLYATNAVPSIVFGILGLVVFVRLLGWGKSWLAGGVILGLMILPTLTVSLVARIEALPRRYLDAASGLGLSRSRVVRSVILPQSRGGLVAGGLLGLARAAGETAPIMFTAAVFSGATLPKGFRDSPVLALPYHIFVLAQDTFNQEVHTQMWAAAFVLLALVFLFSLVSLPARLGRTEEARHG